MHPSARSIAVAVGLLAAASAHAQAPAAVVAMQQPEPNPYWLQARVAELSAANRELTAQIGQLRQELDTVKTQQGLAPHAVARTQDDNTVYVTSKADKRYENWYGLSIGDSWRLHDDTPIKLIEPNDSKLSYKILPAGTVVTIIGAPRGVAGTYAVAVERGTSGWATLR